MKTFKDIMVEKELSDDEVIGKVAKKIFGAKAFDKVTRGTIVSLKQEHVPYKDLRDFEMNLSSMDIDQVVADGDLIKIWLKKK